jgi:hypothetical protein
MKRNGEKKYPSLLEYFFSPFLFSKRSFEGRAEPIPFIFKAEL